MKGKFWNKCLSLIVIMAMLMMTFAGSGITAMAGSGSPQPITAVDLSIDEQFLLAGATYTASSYSTAVTVTNTSSDYNVTNIMWEDSGGFPLTDGHVFVSGNDYRVIVQLETATASFIAMDDIVAVINGYPARVIEEQNGTLLKLEWIFRPTVSNTIDTISLLNVPEAIEGEAITPYNYTHTDGTDTIYTATGKWEVWNTTSKTYEAATGANFVSGKIYRQNINIKTAPGVKFDYYVDVYLNGEEFDGKQDEVSEYEINLYCVYPLGLEMIDGISIDEDAIPKAELGKTFEDKDISIPVDDSRYTVKGYWIDEEGNREGTFKKGKTYLFKYVVFAAEGYCFEEFINVETGVSFEGISAEGAEAYGTFESSLKTKIDEVTLTNVPEAVVGKTLQAGEFDTTVPAGAKYEAKANWNDRNGMLETPTTVKAGEKYELWVYIEAAEGYRFAEKYYLNINGVKHVEYGGAEYASYYREYSFLGQIDSIEINGIVEPVAGNPALTDSVKAPDSANYEVVSAQWCDTVFLQPVSQFEDGKAYYLEIEVKSKEGYEFAPNAKWTAGKSSGIADPYATENLYLTTDVYSFEKIIDRVDISNIPVKKVGETAKNEVKVPEGANYKAEAEWYKWDEEKNAYQPFSGKFEKNGIYNLYVDITAIEGYRFEEGKTAYYIDGKEAVPSGQGMYYAQYVYFYPGENDKVIDKIELTIDKPKAGEHSSIAPVVKIVNDDRYELDLNGDFSRDPYWTVKVLDYAADFDGYFEDGKEYGVNFVLLAKDGYVFAEDITIVINGISIPTDRCYNSIKELLVSYTFDMECQHVYDDDKDSICNVCGYDRNLEVPNTADRLPLGMNILIMSLGLVAVIKLFVLKRRTI